MDTLETRRDETTIVREMVFVPGLKDVGCLEFMVDDPHGRPLKGQTDADQPLVGIDELGNAALSEYLKRLLGNADVCRVVLDATGFLLRGTPDRRSATVRIVLCNRIRKPSVVRVENVEYDEYLLHYLTSVVQ